MRRVRSFGFVFVVLAALAFGACGEVTVPVRGWQPGGTYGVPGWSPSSLAAGDFDEDGLVDLVVADARDGRVYLFEGLGRGRFDAEPAVPLLGMPGEQLVRAGEVDGDGRLDVVLIELATGGIRTYFGNGKGGFVESAPAPPLGGTRVGLRDVCALRVDGDDLTDLVVLDELGDLFVFVANGDGTFAAAGASLASATIEEIAFAYDRFERGIESADELPQGVRDVAVHDLTGDGVADLAVTVPSAGEVRVFLNDVR